MKKVILTTIVIVSVLGILAFLSKRSPLTIPLANQSGHCEEEVPGPNDDIVTVDGARLKIIGSDVFACRAGEWVLQSSIQEPSFKDISIMKNPNGCEMANTKTGEKISFANDFANGFEVPTFLDLFKSADGTTLAPWTNFTVLSPETPTVESYVKFRKQVMLEGANFLDNRVDLDTKNPHTGKTAARFYTVNPQPAITVGKAQVEKIFSCFAKGDDIWFSGWFYLEKGIPSTLVDFNTSKFKERPGTRLFIRENQKGQQFATVELRSVHKLQYNQWSVPLPRQKWFNLKMHLKLSNHEDGLIEVWQDGAKIISTNGQTLPTYDTIYNVFSIGVTTTSAETALLVDDVVVSGASL